jgi:hypothetical protein
MTVCIFAQVSQACLGLRFTHFMARGQHAGRQRLNL